MAGWSLGESDWLGRSGRRLISPNLVGWGLFPLRAGGCIWTGSYGEGGRKKLKYLVS
jgi:hypothetical protein